jgi:hypothetical protein
MLEMLPVALGKPGPGMQKSLLEMLGPESSAPGNSVGVQKRPPVALERPPVALEILVPEKTGLEKTAVGLERPVPVTPFAAQMMQTVRPERPVPVTIAPGRKKRPVKRWKPGPVTIAVEPVKLVPGTTPVGLERPVPGKPLAVQKKWSVRPERPGLEMPPVVQRRQYRVPRHQMQLAAPEMPLDIASIQLPPLLPPMLLDRPGMLLEWLEKLPVAPVKPVPVKPPVGPERPGLVMIAVELGRPVPVSSVVGQKRPPARLEKPGPEKPGLVTTAVEQKMHPEGLEMLVPGNSVGELKRQPVLLERPGPASSVGGLERPAPVMPLAGQKRRSVPLEMRVPSKILPEKPLVGPAMQPVPLVMQPVGLKRPPVALQKMLPA